MVVVTSSCTDAPPLAQRVPRRRCSTNSAFIGLYGHSRREGISGPGVRMEWS